MTGGISCERYHNLKRPILFLDMSDKVSTAPILDPGDQPVDHYSLKHRVTAWISQHVFDRFVYEVRHGLNKGLKRKGGLGFLPEFLAGSAETVETRFWSQFQLSGKVVYDVGAFEGILACFFARQAKHVVCFEPNPPTHERLRENLRLNGFDNVTLCKIGLGSRPDSFTLVWDPLMPGGASAEKNAQDQMRRQNTGRLREETIRVSTLDAECAASRFPPPDFIKIDVEGLELEVLKGGMETLQRYRPELFLEMHGETMNEKRRKVAGIVDFLLEAGYRRILHIESGSNVDQSNSAVAAEGHLYCQAS